MNTNDFYRAFEDRFRGPRELINERFKIYLPFITPFRALYQPSTAIDLGCGRGEWLELLQQQGFEPHGVDLDTHMLGACRERSLPITRGDAIDHLKSLSESSQCVVSGFHISEHIAFEELKELASQALRVLKPGGLLILETPNPENLSVGSCNFYLDPTHQRPLPPLLLAFLAEHIGFARVKTVRMQELPDLRERSDIGLIDVLNGASPDYAIVAQKAGASDVLSGFDGAFAVDYGIELRQLAQRYDEKIDRQWSALNQRIARAETSLNALCQTVSLHERLQNCHHDLASKLAAEKQLRARISELEKELEHRVSYANALTVERDALRRSLSWRLTAPARCFAERLSQPTQWLRQGANLTLSTGINVFQRPLSRLMAAILREPRRSHRINNWLLANFPALHSQLRDIGRIQGIVPEHTGEEASAEYASPSPRVRQIYTELYLAIEKHKARKEHVNREQHSPIAPS